MQPIELLKRLREHQEYARHKLLAAAESLNDQQLRQSFEIGTGSIWNTLVHLYAAEFVWLEAIEGNPSPISPWQIKFDAMSDLIVAWQSLDSRWSTFFDGLEPSDLKRSIAKQSTSSGAGKLWATPLSDVLLHIPLHAQYTTAQAINMLRHLGVEYLPDTMFITMSRLQNSNSSADS